MGPSRKTSGTESSIHNASTNDAIVRLVKALQRSSSPDDEASAIDLANFILESQLGGGGASSFESKDSTAATTANQHVFQPSWTRRIESSTLCRSDSQRQDLQLKIEQLYQELNQACQSGSHQNDNGLPSKLMTVLTKCIGANNTPQINTANSFSSMAAASFDAGGNTASHLHSKPAASFDGGGNTTSRLYSKPAASFDTGGNTTSRLHSKPAASFDTGGNAASRLHSNAAAASGADERHSRLGGSRNHSPKKQPPKTNTTANKDSLGAPKEAMQVEEPSFLHRQPKFAQPSDAFEYEEQQVLRELLYALQGIDGERIKFYTKDNVKQGYYEGEEEKHYQYECIHVLSPALQGAENFFRLHQGEGQVSWSSSSRLGSGALDALKICGEAGWLVRRLQHYVDSHLGVSVGADPHGSGAGGHVSRALARAVAQELQAYHDFLAQLEVHLPTWSLRQWLIQIQRQPVLMRLMVLGMITEAIPSQPSNGVVVGGGTLLSALHLHSLHGDSRQKALVQSILYPTSQPWFHMLYMWTTQGLLPASWGGDFFVTLQTGQFDPTSKQLHRKEDQKHLWHDKYTINQSQLPHAGIFDRDLVRPAFVIGKGINFIRSCLNQVGWTLNLQDVNNDKKSKATTTNLTGANNTEESEDVIMRRFGYHYVPEPQGLYLNPTLRKSLLQAEKFVHSHILQSLRNDHNLFEHLFALKQFLFHGQGDFFSSLLEGLYSEFGCGTKNQSLNANTSFIAGQAVAGVYPQQLLSIMENALRQTNAKDLPAFCLELLTVEMLPFQPNKGSGLDLFASPNRNLLDVNENDSAQEEDTRSVWDIFQLDYTVPDPLVAIVHEKAMQQYKLIYSFLFGLRKVEYMLNRTWRQSATLQHALQKMAQNNGLQASSSPGYALATVLLRKISMTRQAMTHFCVNLKSYCMLEVIEGEWKELLDRLERARTLDEAIQAHDYYLEGICRKMLLLSKRRRNRNGSSTASGTYEKFRHLFSTILSVSTDFCVLQERVFDEALEAAERVSQRRREAERRMALGEWGFENDEGLREEENFFGLAEATELEEVVSLSESFYQCMQNFLEALDAKVHGRSRNMSTTMVADEDFEIENGNSLFPYAAGEEQDVDSLRCLIHQLDHNHYYGLLHY